MNGEAWPPVGGETVRWQHDPHEVMSRRERVRSSGSYVASVPSLIASLPLPALPDDVLAAAAEAHAELSRFDAEVESVPAPLTAILLRTESSASSEVERLTASAKQVALASIGDTTSSNASLVVANTRAMEAAIELSQRLEAATVIEMHRALLEQHDASIVGTFRDSTVWIGGRTPHTAQYVAPVAERVPALMDDLMAFARRTDIPALAHVALAHAQFETIHPFPDGNGRTGRALAHAMLRATGVTRHVTVPVSAGLLADIDAYFQALDAYRAGDPVPIVDVFTNSTFRALTNSRTLVAELDEIRREWEQRTRARAGSSARRALDLLPAQPVLTAKYVADRLGVSDVAAGAAIANLVEAGILAQSSAGRRNRHWQAPEVLDALDRFAQRARRART